MKSFKRILIIIQNSANNLVTPVIGVLFSYIIIKKFDIVLWGNFVYYLIIIGLTVHILGWGNKEYLLREFSKKPDGIKIIWLRCIFMRIVFFPVILIPYYFLSQSGIEFFAIVLITFILFIYQSFDVLITFRRRFIVAVYIEIISFVILLTLFLLFGSSNIYSLLIIYLLSLIIKPVLMIFYFRNEIQFNFRDGVKLNFEFFRYSFPFFIISFTGMLQSRLDIYCVGFYLPKESLGKYQVLVNFLAIFQSVAGFILAPFVKDIYRLNDSSLRKIWKKMILTGSLLILPFLLILYIAVTYFYKFEISPDYYIYSVLFILPVYFYIVLVYNLYKNGSQNMVIKITVTGIIVNLISNILLIPVLQIKGALLSNIISQIFMMLSYSYLNVKYYSNLTPEKS